MKKKMIVAIAIVMTIFIGIGVIKGKLLKKTAPTPSAMQAVPSAAIAIPATPQAPVPAVPKTFRIEPDKDAGDKGNSERHRINPGVLPEEFQRY
ncbi:MAG: hypothetical protein ACYC69_02660 [Thermodesulfovibrionales bacterium]